MLLAHEEEEHLRLARTNQRMARLISAIQELSLARDLNAIMAVVRKAARELTGADGATFVLRDGDLCHYADEDAISPLWKGQRFPLKTCVSGWAMLHRKPAVIPDIFDDPRVPVDAYRKTFVKSMAMVPIRTESPIGAIGNYWATSHEPTDEDVEFLQALANTTSVAMENVRVHEELEQRVERRTAELQAANDELDSFAHAVSHDLGAPLRCVRAFAELLTAESGSALSEKGTLYLDRIQTSAIQMRTLMDDLMRLSNVTRIEMKEERVDLSALAREIVTELAAASPDRTVDVRIADKIKTVGDRALLRIALDNLLSNAWKYTSKTKKAKIEFGTVAQPHGSTSYFVRDNGVGFKMEYAGKLFQPFQRMHRMEEFPGTGIGLTTVQRIIKRHGGTVRGEAEENKGATFYFTVANSH